MPQSQIPLIKGDKTGPETDYRDGLPINMYAVQKNILGAAGYMQNYSGIRPFEPPNIYFDEFNGTGLISNHTPDIGTGIYESYRSFSQLSGGSVECVPFDDRGHFWYNGLNQNVTNIEAQVQTRDSITALGLIWGNITQAESYPNKIILSSSNIGELEGISVYVSGSIVHQRPNDIILSIEPSGIYTIKMDKTLSGFDVTVNDVFIYSYTGGAFNFDFDIGIVTDYSTGLTTTTPDRVFYLKAY